MLGGMDLFRGKEDDIETLGSDGLANGEFRSKINSKEGPFDKDCIGEVIEGFSVLVEKLEGFGTIILNMVNPLADGNLLSA